VHELCAIAFAACSPHRASVVDCVAVVRPGVRPFQGAALAAPRLQAPKQHLQICEAASLQFIPGVNESTVPDVSLRRSRTGTSGQAMFTFENPTIFQASSELGDITGRLIC
jgi:photosystem II protein